MIAKVTAAVAEARLREAYQTAFEAGAAAAA